MNKKEQLLSILETNKEQMNEEEILIVRCLADGFNTSKIAKKIKKNRKYINNKIQSMRFKGIQIPSTLAEKRKEWENKRKGISVKEVGDDSLTKKINKVNSITFNKVSDDKGHKYILLITNDKEMINSIISKGM